MRRTIYSSQYGHISGGSLYPMRRNKWFKDLQANSAHYAKGWLTDSANSFKKESDYIAQKNSNQIRLSGGSISNMKPNIRQIATNLQSNLEPQKLKFTPTMSMMKKLKLN